ncbi:MAG: hypothetical protein AAFX54_03540 [Pseudomonadota bacterium]
MDDQRLQDMLRVYVSETEAIETARKSEPAENLTAQFHIRVWWRQNGKALVLLTVAVAAALASALSLDIATLSGLALGGVASLALLFIGAVSLMID